MSKGKISGKIRTLLALACSLGILALASDGRSSHVKAQYDPRCAQLILATLADGGTVEYCGTDSQLNFSFDASFSPPVITLSELALVSSSIESLEDADVTWDGTHLHLVVNN